MRGQSVAKTLLVVISCFLVGATADHKIAADTFDEIPLESRSTAEAPDAACGTFGAIPVIAGASASSLSHLYRSIGFDLDALRKGTSDVPPIMVADIPDDLASVKPVEQRKAIFLKAVLPAILFVNERIQDERRFLETVRARQRDGAALSAEQKTRLHALADCYGTAPADIAALLGRVDVVPAGLSLAQAAIESGWGTSRFARNGNALLGQRTYGGDGIVPAGLSNPEFRVRAFDHILTSVAAYAHNLNTHPAYRGFRDSRAALRRDGRTPDSHTLAGSLQRYSERGRAYVSDVRAIMRANRLLPFDHARPAAPSRVALAGS